LVERARRLTPSPPAWIYNALGAGYYLRGEYEEALSALNSFGLVFDVQTELFRVATLGQLGRLPEAEAALRRLQASYPAFAREPQQELKRYLVVPTTIEAVADGLRLAGFDAEREPLSG
jgi:tetratricopeptide (TPR) repeat protein